MSYRRPGPGILLVVAVLLGGTGCSAGQTDSSTAPVQFILAEQVRALQAAGRLVAIVDVRTREEYEAVHIEGAVNLPLAELERRAAEIPREVPVVLY